VVVIPSRHQAGVHHCRLNTVSLAVKPNSGSASIAIWQSQNKRFGVRGRPHEAITEIGGQSARQFSKPKLIMG
jgi:hypothetical protein